LPPPPRIIVSTGSPPITRSITKHEDRDAEERRNHQQETLNDVAKHGSAAGEGEAPPPPSEKNAHLHPRRYRSSQTSVRSCPT
jgi:hypothetical protein